jgi:hypothetical protein
MIQWKPWTQKAREYTKGHTMKQIQEKAAQEFPHKGDRIYGWFGDAVVTDVAFGYLDIEGEEVGPVDNMVRIAQTTKSGHVQTTFIYRQDIERNYTAEDAMLRA